MAETKVLLTESSVLQNFSVQCKNNSLDVTPEEGEWFIKAILAGITEFLNIYFAILQNISMPEIY